MALQLVAGKASLEVRALSRTILRWRNSRDWSLAELEKRVGFSDAKLSQLCTAVQRASPAEVLKIGAACGASDEEIELCVRVAQRAIDPQMWDRINGDAWTRLAWTSWDVMAEASELVLVATDVLPELARIEAYHDALLEAGVTASDLNIAARKYVLERLRIGAKEASRRGSPQRLRARLIVTEPVVASSIGGVQVMAEQLGYLEELTRQAGFEFAVVDSDVAACFGMGTTFTMMRFVEKRFDDVVLLRTLHGGDTWLESAAESEPYERALVALDEAVHSGAESLRRLRRASVLLQEPLPGNNFEGCRPRLSVVTDRAED